MVITVELAVSALAIAWPIPRPGNAKGDIANSLDLVMICGWLIPERDTLADEAMADSLLLQLGNNRAIKAIATSASSGHGLVIDSQFFIYLNNFGVYVSKFCSGCSRHAQHIVITLFQHLCFQPFALHPPLGERSEPPRGQ